MKTTNNTPTIDKETIFQAGKTLIDNSFAGGYRYDRIYASNMFIAITGKIPSQIGLSGFYDTESIISHIGKLVPKDLSEFHIIKKYFSESGSAFIDEALLPIANDIFVFIHNAHTNSHFNPLQAKKTLEEINSIKGKCYVNILYTDTSEKKTKALIDKISKFKTTKSTVARCSIISQSSGSALFLKEFNITEPVMDNMILSYGEEFIGKDKILKERLKETNGKGIALLHGKYGTGKTNYIRHLISFLQKNGKKTIYVPPHLVNNLSSPNFISFMMDNANSVLIIEDAESILVSREEKAGNMGVHNLLNISDGLLGEAMSVQLVCTFNTEMSKIDDAILRKGRIIMRHEFNALPKEQANKLSKHLGFNGRFEEDTTLAEIYNQKDKNYSKTSSRKPVGFNQAVKA